MYDTPQKLQDCCVDFICDNMSALCEAQETEEEETRLVFKDNDIFFHGNISEHLLNSLCDKGKLNDTTLGLFQSDTTMLKRVRLRDGHDGPLTLKGLRILKTHKISELEAIGLEKVCINELIGCLGEWTMNNLRLLNVANGTFTNSTKLSVIVSLCKLQALHTLNVSNTDFNQHGLEVICRDMVHLENLDLSNTVINDIGPVRHLKYRLRSLSMYNLRISNCDNVLHVLKDCANLQHLDISDDTQMQPFVGLQPSKFEIASLLILQGNFLPFLSSLDISGKDGLKIEWIRSFLEVHPNVHFLGLALTDLCEQPMFRDENSSEYASHIKVTGEASEKQIIESLRRYSHRAIYMQKSLYHLFSLTQAMAEPRSDILELLIPGAENHPDHLSVQMAATACMYNLSKGERGASLHPKWLKEIVRLTMAAMENFPNVQQLQKNALLTLCSDKILQDVNFDRFHCAKLVMECLCTFTEPSMIRMSVAICSILAAKTTKLGSQRKYMKKLLLIVKEKAEDKQVDITMKFTLSALWNLTDESPDTCDVFLEEDGLNLYMAVIEAYKDCEEDNKLHVQTKVLGLLNNLAEVKHLRNVLMVDQFCLMIRGLLNTPKIQVSYFAAGIVAHLASEGAHNWCSRSVPRPVLLEDLGKAVNGWEQPCSEMVAYRSFTPFIELLACSDPEVQLWAVWAMEHVCRRNGQRYCSMLVEEGGKDLLVRLDQSLHTHPQVKKIVSSILLMLEKGPDTPGKVEALKPLEN
ncbi:protein zyg-11 homolog B-like isoform X2 [Lineus longissimus]|uniref:protein zyg-11 homolog B-like isoform X2 n=1 Tax=Lineus longissimus TaxID=88925 RepID=UPI00315DBC3C